MNENEIRDLLGEGIGEEPQIVGGPAAVFAGARRQTVRTRAIAGAVSVVAVLGIAGGTVAFSGGAGKPGDKVPPGMSSPPAPAASTARPGQVLMDGRSVDELIRLTLPTRLTTGVYAGEGDTWASSHAVGSMSVNDGLGQPTQVIASVGRRTGEAVSALACQDMFHTMPEIKDCRAYPQRDGSVVLVYRNDDNHRDAHGTAVDAYQLIAERLFPNGLSVLVAASNWFAPPTTPAMQTGTIGPSRPSPLVSQDELVAIVMDPRWGLSVSADFARQAERDITPFTDMTGGATEASHG